MIKDYKIVANQLIEKLCDKTLEPRPHFRILLSKPNQDDDEDLKTWETSEKSEIGFIITDSNLSNKQYTTNFEFYNRYDEGNFFKTKLKIILNKDNEIHIDCISELNGSIECKIDFDFSGTGEIRIPFKIRNRKSFIITLEITKRFKKIKGDNGKNINKVLLKINNISEKVNLRIDRKSYDFISLLNYKLTEYSDNSIITNNNLIKGYGLIPQIKKEPEEVGYSKIDFYDYYIGETEIYPMKSSKQNILSFVSELKKENMDIEEELIEYISNEGYNLYSFQERAIQQILKQHHSNKKPVIISARTAAGKTEAFVLPLINEILRIKKENKEKSVKSLLFYPTKSLANDQMQRIIDILYKINKISDVPVTVGAYHGDIEEKINLNLELPIKCPKCKEEGARLRPLEDGTVQCVNPKCKEIHNYIYVDRRKVIVDLPDFLISTPDSINYFMINDERKHTLLGKPYSGEFYYKDKSIEKIDVKPEGSVRFIILDELHLFSSLFGGNISIFLKRLSFLIKEYKKTYHKDDGEIQYIASSATIKNPLSFSSDFFGTESVLVETTKDDEDKDSEPLKKIIIFCCPKSYRMIDTTSYSIVRAMEFSNLKILTFVNSLPLCGMILNNTKTRLSADDSYQHLVNKFNGHTSHYSREEKAKIEGDFDKNELIALVATSGLEVGVDFKEVNLLILYGLPYSFNNYLQRIGRAGRKNDSIIMNIMNPMNPIDLYYYRNAIEIIHNPTYYIEYPTLPNENQQLKNKHIVASIFDICNLKSINKEDMFSWLFSDNSNFKQILDYLSILWGKKEVEEVIVFIKERFSRGTIKEKYDYINKFYKLSDLRKIEETVEIEFDIEDYVGMDNFSKNNRSSYFEGGRGRLYNQFNRNDAAILRKIK